jgi:hypothetical protein
MAKKPRSKLPEITLPTDLAGLDAIAFEIFEPVPEAFGAAKEIADKEGVEYRVWVYTTFAEAYRRIGQPIPPDMRDYLLEQGKRMTPEQRKKFVTPFIS